MKRHQARKRVRHTVRRTTPKREPPRDAEKRALDAYDRISFGYDLSAPPTLEEPIGMYEPS